MGVIQNLLGPFKHEKKFAKFFLIPLDPETATPLSEVRDNDIPPMRLQYWPETLDYTRGSIGWEEKQIPGSSHPLQSWTGNGAPTVSFDATFTEDTDPGYSLEKGVFDNVATKAENDPNREYAQSVNINAAMAWFAACSNPLYSQNSDGPSQTPVKPPPIIQLVPEISEPVQKAQGQPSQTSSFGPDTDSLGQRNNGEVSSGNNDRAVSTRGVSISHLAERDFYGVLKDFTVTYEKFFPSGHPRIAKVAITLTEIIQLGDVILPHDRRDNVKIAKQYRFSGSNGQPSTSSLSAG